MLRIQEGAGKNGKFGGILTWFEGRASRLARLSAFGATAAGVEVLAGALIGPRLPHPVASRPTKPGPLPPGVFKPTEAQWKGFKIASVASATFRFESFREGNIALDDDPLDLAA